MRYQTSMIRAIRFEERRIERLRIRIIAFTAASFGLLALSIFYATLQILQMNAAIANEERALERVKTEYSQYRTTQEVIDKEDLERLNTLKNKGVLWTKKLAVLAYHLPESYWITGFSYDQGILNVKGFGLAPARQDQLITINGYLNRLRADTTFSDFLTTLHLNSTERKDEAGSPRVSFDFSAMSAGARR